MGLVNLSFREPREILARADAILTNGHFVLNCGRHSDSYVAKDKIYTNPQRVSELCIQIAQHFQPSGGQPFPYEVVAGAEKGGIILSQWTAFYSMPHWDSPPVSAVYAEKERDGFVFRRGYDRVVTGKKVLVVEDVLTTGGSTRRVVEAIRALGGEVSAVAALCSREKITAEDVGGVPELFILLELSLPSWSQEDCPSCRRGISVNQEFGKGKDFLARQ